MLQSIASRLGSALLVMLGVCTLVFLLIHLIPGDPVTAMLGESARPADQQALRLALGLDRPLAEQYASYLTGLLQLDLGYSFQDQRPVAGILGERLPATLQLAGASLLLALMLAVPLGLLAAYRNGSPWDAGAMTFSLLGISIPNFWLGPLLIMVFSLWLGWTPVSGNDQPLSLLLPAVTLGTALSAVLARMVRASVLEVLGEDYVRTARAKGLSEFAVLRRHALRNAWLPVLTLVGLQLGGLLGGAVITETVFAWPGVGSLLVESIQARDFPLVQGCVLLISLVYVFVNMLTDLAYTWIDPRIALR
ncbi:MAG TPA: glutathione ABC transporter permease GsiC [Chromatiaceae bacterium]|nr:MAG: ABC transporter permease [Thiohalocapsa sp. PB-PSB1]HBG95360.1 glutathione ABC transporter permease GsiC [Chromatiaceae bacterium]HCS92381.1 glutathione ABC transporter permease GsiC [Chromatiaceae bacterium]